jgi:hypothetical protein
MLHERTREYIRSLKDAELWEYIQTGTERYEPEAVTFARKQFEERELDPEQIGRIEAEAKSRATEEAADRVEAAARHLRPMGKIMAFIGGCLGLPALFYLLIWYNFRTQGEHQKARELWTYGFAGLGAVLILAAVVRLMSPRHKQSIEQIPGAGQVKWGRPRAKVEVEHGPYLNCHCDVQPGRIYAAVCREHLPTARLSRTNWSRWTMDRAMGPSST